MKFTRSFGMTDVFSHSRYELRTVVGMPESHTVGVKLVGMKIILSDWYEMCMHEHSQPGYMKQIRTSLAKKSDIGDKVRNDTKSSRSEQAKAATAQHSKLK